MEHVRRVGPRDDAVAEERFVWIDELGNLLGVQPRAVRVNVQIVQRAELGEKLAEARTQLDHMRHRDARNEEAMHVI